MDLTASIARSVATLQALASLAPAIERAAAHIVATLHRGNQLLIAGNGGSAAEASHFATELVGRFGPERRPLPALNLTADGALLTGLFNDYPSEQVFARQIAAHGRPGDLLVLISSSGNSANLLAALPPARTAGLSTLALLGRDGGRTAGLADHEIIVPGLSGRAAQEAHLFLIHHFCDHIDATFVTAPLSGTGPAAQARTASTTST